jgi:pimeloyl-ACP methyl ester carboxylesterase
VDLTHITAPTRFVEGNGVRFAYRRFGRESGIPLLFFQHFRGGMDHWDPAVTDGFAKDRPVVLFDNAGVAGNKWGHSELHRSHGRPRRRVRECAGTLAG